MKKTIILLSLFLLATFGAGTLSSCSRKTGCPSTEAASIKTDRKGQLSTKRGNTNLFPKKMRRN